MAEEEQRWWCLRSNRFCALSHAELLGCIFECIHHGVCVCVRPIGIVPMAVAAGGADGDGLDR